MVNEDNSHNFAMKASIINKLSKVNVNSQCLLVDCGATSLIISDKSEFVRFDNNFDPSSHFIELADGSRTNNLVFGRGDASVILSEVNGQTHTVSLKDALCVPTYKQDIFSVQAATDEGVSVMFNPHDAELISQNGTIFEIEKKGKLYYLNNVKNNTTVTRSLKEWHIVLGHCNVRDILKLEEVVEGMKINNKNKFSGDTCVKGKMTQYRNRTPDKRATRNLDLVHCDLAGPIDPVAKGGFRYAISFVDYYSGIILVYFSVSFKRELSLGVETNLIVVTNSTIYFCIYYYVLC